MKKRIFSLILALAMLCALLPQAALTASAATYSGSCGAAGDNLTWSLDTETGLLTITGSGAMADYTYSNPAPWYDYRELITAISLPEGLISIGWYAFCGCKALTSVTIPDSVTSIGDWAFYGCGALTGVTIPDSVTSIGEGAFVRCSSLTSVNIGNGVTSIGVDAFWYCHSLTAIDVAVGNPNYTSVNGVLFNKAQTKLIQYPAGKPDTSYQIPDSVTSIGDWAFYKCSALTSVTIPDSVTSIGERAFEDCSALTSVTIPNGVTSIGESVFSGCSSLTSVTIPNSVTSIGNVTFYRCSALTSVTIPDSVTSIGERAFEDCSALTSVTIPNGVTSIGESVFSGCSALTSVTIPDSVTSIGDLAFFKCSALTSVTIPDGVTIIGNSAFYNCSALTSVTIPDSVTGIGEAAFAGCSALTSVTIPDSVTDIGGYAFRGCSALTSVTIPNSVTSIGGDAFSGTAYYNDSNNWDGQLLYIGSWLIAAKEEIESADIKQGTTGIADGAFWGCSALTSVTIGNSVTSIGDLAFYKCSALTSVTIPNSVTSIGGDAFRDTAYYNDSNNWDGQLLYIDSWLIKAKKEIEGAEIKQGTIGIAVGTFSDCRALTSVTIPDSVTSIGDLAFNYCTALTDVTIPDSVTSIGDFAFFDCTALTDVTIPDSVTSIGDFAFFDCSALTSVTIGNGVTSIGYGVFSNCSALTSVTIPASVTSIGDKAFGYYYDDKIDGFTIYGYPGTAAESYATENGFPFVALEGFSDVAESDYFFNPVMWATTHEPPITAGVAPGLFGPHKPCTREQIVTFLWAANGKPAPAGTGSMFSDVPADAWYYKPVMWAVENKVTSGMPDGSFGVGQPCTRAQAMTFLWASKGRPEPASSSMESTFSDVSSGDWFCKAILWAAENGITAGIGNGLFGVNDTCTRAQIITFLYKAYN